MQNDVQLVAWCEGTYAIILSNLNVSQIYLHHVSVRYVDTLQFQGYQCECRLLPQFAAVWEHALVSMRLSCICENSEEWSFSCQHIYTLWIFHPFTEFTKAINAKITLKAREGTEFHNILPTIKLTFTYTQFPVPSQETVALLEPNLFLDYTAATWTV